MNSPAAQASQLRVDNRWHFGVPIMEGVLAPFAERKTRIRDAILALRAQEAGITRSNQRGWHSTNTLYLTKDPELLWLVDQIYLLAASCIRRCEGERFQGDVRMTDFWANVNEAGSWNAPHSHLPNEWSGVFYVDAEAACAQRPAGSMDGDILFMNTLPGGLQFNRPPFVNCTPRDGQFFLFPGYLVHMVAPHSASVPRISVAFNFKLESARTPSA